MNALGLRMVSPQNSILSVINKSIAKRFLITSAQEFESLYVNGVYSLDHLHKRFLSIKDSLGLVKLQMTKVDLTKYNVQIQLDT
jgi:hypothetical protein